MPFFPVVRNRRGDSGRAPPTRATSPALALPAPRLARAMFAAVDRGTARTPWEFSLGLGSSGSTGASSFFPRRNRSASSHALAHRDAETRRETLVPGPRPRARGRRARADRARRDAALRAPIARARFAPTRRARARARAPRRAGRTRRENAIATRGAPGADARKNEQSRRSGDADLLTSDGQRAATCTNAAPFGERNDFQKPFPNAHRKHPNALPWSASVNAPHPTHTPDPTPPSPQSRTFARTSITWSRGSSASPA